ncbi:Asp23/Gls24 family envelope stress response protein, partial [Phytoactinopolyspora endophytica]|uniref:Asp23/Gls24 family envelope stress response protein n=1 Tax=Phytoactinopolyspora endophytica TaxID=1642495 RepID=UPI0013ECF280
MVLSDMDAREHASSDASTRGGLRIDDRVIRRVAEQAAAEITGRSGRSSGLDVLAQRPLPRASVEVIGRRVRAEVNVSASGDGSVPVAAQRVRDRVAERIGELTGMTADIVDVHVTVVEDAPAPGEADSVLRPAREPTRPGHVRKFGLVLAVIVIGLGAVGIYDLVAG